MEHCSDALHSLRQWLGQGLGLLSVSLSLFIQITHFEFCGYLPLGFSLVALHLTNLLYDHMPSTKATHNNHMLWVCDSGINIDSVDDFQFDNYQREHG